MREGGSKEEVDEEGLERETRVDDTDNGAAKATGDIVGLKSWCADGIELR